MPETLTDLAQKKCHASKAGDSPLDSERITALLAALPGWNFQGTEITKQFGFNNYHETIAFINATAWVSHREDHHPDLQVGYNKVHVRYSTHSVGGLSENDFICAAKIEKLLII